jgi:hypothetical protein
MGLVAAQTLGRRKFAPKRAKTRQDFLGAGQAANFHLPIILEQVDLVAFLQPKFTYEVRRKADRK